jgi:hypothetical protein
MTGIELGRTFFYASPFDTPLVEDVLHMFQEGSKSLDLYRLPVDENMIRSMSDAPLVESFNLPGKNLSDTLKIGQDTPLSRMTSPLIQERIPMARALTLTNESIRGVKPELFVPHAFVGYGEELNIGNMSLDDTVKVLQARLSGGQMESRGGRTIAFSGEESKIMGQTLEHLKASQGARVGVQTMETASKVMEGMGQALKVMRSIR